MRDKKKKAPASRPCTTQAYTTSRHLARSPASGPSREILASRHLASPPAVIPRTRARAYQVAQSPGRDGHHGRSREISRDGGCVAYRFDRGVAILRKAFNRCAHCGRRKVRGACRLLAYVRRKRGAKKKKKKKKNHATVHQCLNRDRVRTKPHNSDAS